MTELSVVIATKDRAPFLRRALESLILQREPPSFETIVVDNGSSDETPSVVAEAGRRAHFAVHRIAVPQPNRAR
ncbi:MAG: glycosyltransferase family 2 protein, partial [Candidatus Eremiobacteraeota bacterium]|nr:glycosyltransferase family 2 protein [Candidatus Eremiobacteraeota bacterium]